MTYWVLAKTFSPGWVHYRTRRGFRKWGWGSLRDAHRYTTEKGAAGAARKYGGETMKIQEL